MEYPYIVVKGTTVKMGTFQQDVNSYLEKGYSPAGGVSVVLIDDKWAYDAIYQAMYKPVVAEAVVGVANGGASGGAEAPQGGSGRSKSRSRKTRRR